MIGYIIYLQASFVFGGLLVMNIPSAAWLLISFLILLISFLFYSLRGDSKQLPFIKCRKLDKTHKLQTSNTYLNPALKRALYISHAYFLTLLLVFLWDKWQKWHGFPTDFHSKGFIISTATYMCLISSIRLCLKKLFAPAAIYIIAVLFSFCFFRGITSI